MKATRKEVEPKFEPITITIESEKEANLIWYALNIANTMLPQFYTGDKTARENIQAIDSYPMWDNFDEVFTPKGEVTSHSQRRKYNGV